MLVCVCFRGFVVGFFSYSGAWFCCLGGYLFVSEFDGFQSWWMCGIFGHGLRVVCGWFVVAFASIQVLSCLS